MLMTPTPTKRKDNKIKKTRTSVRAHTLNTTHKKKNGKKNMQQNKTIIYFIPGHYLAMQLGSFAECCNEICK